MAITEKLRAKYTGFPGYVIPLMYKGNSAYSCLDTSKLNFPVLTVHRKQVLTTTPWYEAFTQTHNSFEDWLVDQFIR